MGFFDEGITWVIGILLIAIIGITVVLPTINGIISTSDIVGTSTDEIFAGTAATPHAMSFSPIVAVTAFKKSTNTTAYNDTLLSTNASANLSNAFTLSATYDNGAITGNGFYVTQIFQIGDGSNVTVFRNGVNMATISVSNTHTFGPYTSLTSPVTFTYVFNGANASNVTNTSIVYPQFVTDSAYTVNTGAGTVTPTATGGYEATYTYGTTGSASAKVILTLVPLLLAVVILLIVITSATWMQ